MADCKRRKKPGEPTALAAALGPNDSYLWKRIQYRKVTALFYERSFPWVLLSGVLSWIALQQPGQCGRLMELLDPSTALTTGFLTFAWASLSLIPLILHRMGSTRSDPAGYHMYVWTGGLVDNAHGTFSSIFGALTGFALAIAVEFPEGSRTVALLIGGVLVLFAMYTLAAARYMHTVLRGPADWEPKGREPRKRWLVATLVLSLGIAGVFGYSAWDRITKANEDSGLEKLCDAGKAADGAPGA